LFFAVISISLLGAACAIDEGLIAGIFNAAHFQNSINYSSYIDSEKTNIKANFSSMVHLGAIAGAFT
jgi:hypothetical protein